MYPIYTNGSRNFEWGVQETYVCSRYSEKLTSFTCQCYFQGVNNYITNIIHDGDRLGIVWFSTNATREAELTVIDDTTRGTLVNNIPTIGDGFTSIGSGNNRGVSWICLVKYLFRTQSLAG